MQVNSINRQNFNGVIIPRTMKTQVESDVLRIIRSSADKAIGISKKVKTVSTPEYKLNVRVTEKGKVFVEDIQYGTLIEFKKGSIGKKFLNALNVAYSKILNL